MKTFKAHLILETPWISIRGGKAFFDLEYELFKNNPTDFKAKIVGILNGKSFRDKYGQSVSLKPGNERKTFAKTLSTDPIFQQIDWSIFHGELSNIVKKAIK